MTTALAVTLPLGVDQDSITSGVQQDQGIREVCSGPHWAPALLWQPSTLQLF
ncbi:unnamed protein product, partial [Gadus morhua 'NCC']